MHPENSAGSSHGSVLLGPLANRVSSGTSKSNGVVQHLLRQCGLGEDSFQKLHEPSAKCFPLDCENGRQLAVQRLRKGDEVHLEDFSCQLGPRSKELFSPYPWADLRCARESFQVAIRRSIEGVDAAFLLFFEERPIAHFVLWGVGKTLSFREDALTIPTLGIAVVDRMQGRGFGKRCIRFLQLVAHRLEVDGVELTVAHQNVKAARIYVGCEFCEVGTLRIPLGVDPSISLDDCAAVNDWRDERHMVYIVAKERSQIVYQHLLLKECAQNGPASYAIGD